jgi:hypothetical protein
VISNAVSLLAKDSAMIKVELSSVTAMPLGRPGDHIEAWWPLCRAEGIVAAVVTNVPPAAESRSLPGR